MKSQQRPRNAYDLSSSVLTLRQSVNRWLVGVRIICLVGLALTSVSLSWWTVVLAGALGLSYRWSATRLSATEAAVNDAARAARNPLRGKPPTSALTDLPESQLLDLRAEVLADSVVGAENCEALRAFEPVRLGTACTFARRARLWGCPDWRPGLSLGANAAACAPRLRLFCRLCTHLGLDGFVLRLPADRSRDFSRFSASVLKTLRVLAACAAPDGGGGKAGDCMRDPAGIERRGWVFRLYGQTFFVTAFASFYGPGDSRFAYGAADGFLLLQPEVSFAQHDLPPDTPDTNWDADGRGRQTARDRVRCAFRDAGQLYRVRDTTGYPMIEDIVMVPRGHPELAGVKWWELGEQGAE